MRGSWRRSRGARSVGAAALAAGILLAAVPASASAASITATDAMTEGPASPDVPLEIAIGDSAFAPISTQVLFANGLPIIPGSSRSATFRVRNASPNAGLLTLAMTNAIASNDTLLQSMTVDAVLPGTASTPTTSLANDAGSSCPVLVHDQRIASGGQLLVTVTVTLLASVTGTQSQNQSVGFDFVAGLRDAGSPLSNTSPCAASSFDDDVALAQTGLAHTGSNVLPSIELGSTAAAIGTIALLLVRRRRSPETEGKPPRG